jgi:aspartyl-tRNA(Asn)/glutamyl-tRNA(Gln) amidotransferase subunit A
MSARELTQHALSRIEELNPSVNAFVAVDGDRAVEQAAAVDQIVATGGDPGPLAGIPIGVKDNEDTAGYRTTHGSPLLADAPKAIHDSAHVARLRAAGCVVVGKTNLPEFAWSANTTNTIFGTTRNPWNLEHSSGGSSGGTAAALAAGMVPLATGSDGGGSIRIPSAACGLSGIKPSLGRVPAGGAEGPGWLDLSTKGPMARRIADVITALDVVVGPEATDLRSLPRPEANWPAVLNDPHVPARVAWSPTLGYATVDAEVLEACERAVSVLESLGAEVIEIDTVFDTDPVSDWLTFVGACLLRSLEPYRSEPAWDRMDPLLRFIADSARETSALQIVRIFDECHQMNLRLVELFHDVRLLVTPTTAAAPPPLSLEGSAMINGEVDPNWVKFTYPFNMTRSPAATVCAGLTQSGLPVGIQLIGPQHADLVVLRSAAALEAALGFDELAPVGS